MLVKWNSVKTWYCAVRVRQRPWLRCYSSNSSQPIAIDRTRNIGIIAHIDAGKTTTTERMLYYAGYTRQLGDVDEGSTITDFLPAERARGITIQSAAITFSWPPTGGNKNTSPSPSEPRSSIPHNINLIDTPGHADFTFEVIRSLRVLDGAVCILDSVAGVEAQTEKVWSQASAYQIPRIVFVNKLDRDGAAFARTVHEIGSKLNVWPALCSIPWWNSEGALKGVGDVINLQALAYTPGGDGKQVKSHGLKQLEDEDAAFLAELVKARTALVELLAEHDDQMVEHFLEAEENHVEVKPQDIRDSLRRCTLNTPQQLTPVFAGASFRNIGVQPLLDGVVDLLPSPRERPDPEVKWDSTTSRVTLSAFLSNQLAEVAPPIKPKSKLVSGRASMSLQVIEACALAFKVVSDARRGVLVYVRVYSGKLARNTMLWNTTLQVAERAQRLFRMYANDAVDLDAIEAGQIGVLPGLKFARTGDSLISHPNAHAKAGPPSPASQLQLRPIDVPPPVFFVGVEPNSLADTRHVKECLDLLLREDPSLNVRTDEESGQTHLAGMGELHLEIARDRLVQDLKAKARTGSIEIGYRESVSTASGSVEERYDREVNGKRSEAGVTASVSPVSEVLDMSQHSHTTKMTDENTLTVEIIGLDNRGEPLEEGAATLPEELPLPSVLQSLQNGALSALARGPAFGYPVHSTRIMLILDPAEHITPSTTIAALASVSRLAIQAVLQQSHGTQAMVMMEPVMKVAISMPEAQLGAVVQDISSVRGGSVLSLDASQDNEEGHNSIQQDTHVDNARIYVPPDPFGGTGIDLSVDAGKQVVRTITARVPLKEMVGYLKHLRSLTGGRGTFTMIVDRFDRMGSQRAKAVLNEMAGEAY